MKVSNIPTGEAGSLGGLCRAGRLLEGGGIWQPMAELARAEGQIGRRASGT